MCVDVSKIVCVCVCTGVELRLRWRCVMSGVLELQRSVLWWWEQAANGDTDGDREH